MEQCWVSNYMLTCRRGFRLLSSLLVVFVAIFEGALSQVTGLNEVTDFCARVYHQSVVVNDTLYIDGGFATLTKADSTPQIITVTSGNLLAIDLKSPWDLRVDINITLLGHDVLPGSTVTAPKLARGILYHGSKDDNRIYSFGGTNATSGYGEDGRVWAYTYGPQGAKWGSTTPVISGEGTSKNLINPASGAGVGVPELGLGFWFNGEQDNGTSAATQGIEAGHRFLDGMVVFDFNSGTARNASTSAVSAGARVRGKMVYVPGVGAKGVLVLIGGSEKVAGVDSNDWRGTLVDMDQIHIFDISSLDGGSTPGGTWYQQKAVGTIPNPRIDHCLVLASAQDGSSHNIYMYAGRDGEEQSYDQIYILTLPSFQWVKVYDSYFPRYGMTCDLAGQRQMVVVGGAVNSNITQDCDRLRNGVAVYDLSTLDWSNLFNPDAAPYEVPKPVRDVVGGSSAGGATVVRPVNGFSDSGLASLFSYESVPSAAATEIADPGYSNTSSSNKGAIIGGIVGGVVVVGLICLALFMLCRRRRKGQNPDIVGNSPGELDGTTKGLLGTAHQQYVEMPATYAPQELAATSPSRDEVQGHGEGR